MINIFAYTSPNRSGVGAIDNPDRFEQAFDTYHIPEASETFSWTKFRWSVLRKCEFWVVVGLLETISLPITFTKGNLRELPGRSMLFIFPYDLYIFL
eukprot:UN09693